jgi:hypothetical protein
LLMQRDTNVTITVWSSSARAAAGWKPHRVRCGVPHAYTPARHTGMTRAMLGIKRLSAPDVPSLRSHPVITN